MFQEIKKLFVDGPINKPEVEVGGGKEEDDQAAEGQAPQDGDDGFEQNLPEVSAGGAHQDIADPHGKAEQETGEINGGKGNSGEPLGRNLPHGPGDDANQ